jgi:hypothetical protein
MQAVAVPPDLVTVNAAIAACSLRGRWTGADVGRIWKRWKDGIDTQREHD